MAIQASHPSRKPTPAIARRKAGAPSAHARYRAGGTTKPERTPSMDAIAFHDLSKLSLKRRAALLERTETDLSSYMRDVEPIIAAVREQGDAALIDCARRFDGVALDTLKV
ncbi:MAG: histidinol dehydrogenase, partial [Phyllobacterium sp.]|nr:histidinol dehydrogenase [Phyllobacterium sp.]